MKNIKEQLLNDWAAYDTKKVAEGYNPALFSCNEAWEVFYLGEKIKELKPELELLTIFELIEKCCRNETQPLTRMEFIERVAGELDKMPSH